MFEWFTNIFKKVPVDPEAGVPAQPYTGIGRIEGPNEGTGEGWNWASMNREQYAQLGGQMQRAMQPYDQPKPIQGGLTAGFDQNWLNSFSNQASAHGEKIS